MISVNRTTRAQNSINGRNDSSETKQLTIDNKFPDKWTKENGIRQEYKNGRFMNHAENDKFAVELFDMAITHLYICWNQLRIYQIIWIGDIEDEKLVVLRTID